MRGNKKKESVTIILFTQIIYKIKLCKKEQYVLKILLSHHGLNPGENNNWKHACLIN